MRHDPVRTKSAVSTIAKRTFHYDFRFDGSAHERLFVRRDALPLDPEVRRALEARRYQVFINELPPEDLRAHLARKGHAAKSKDE